MPKLRVAVIGTGRIADEHLRFLASSPEVDLVAVCDHSPAMAQLAGRRFGCSRTFVDHLTMLAEVRPDVTHVLTPPATHTSLARAALERQSHVICEKPAALSLSELMRTLEIARSNQRAFTEDHNYKFNSAFRRLVAETRSPRFGAVREVTATFVLPRGGPRYGNSAARDPSHDLPAGFAHEFLTHMCYMANTFIPDASMRAVKWLRSGRMPWGAFDGLCVELGGSTARGLLRLETQWGPTSNSVCVRGEHGWAEADLVTGYVSRTIPTKAGPQIDPFLRQVVDGVGRIQNGISSFAGRLVGESGYEGIHHFLTETYSALQSGAALPVTEEDVVAVQQLIDAIISEKPA
ncbi:MAG: putative oxidoreductase [Mycobacterium sp.]|nr:putative oxidoreductase [Mycobacterium sp.]